MPFTPGTRLGSYEIVAPLGAGGMGEVYRAKDTKLGRDVAIKVLPESFALDADRVARFTREAKTLASLNHPNIAGIYGLEQSAPSTSSGQAGVTALVMELVDGDDLSVQIARGPIALADALPIARQIAEALEAAHEQGIIHRDLKPANIKVRADGTVKVLDFGLAKAMNPTAASSGEAMNSPTLTMRATQMGMILGTAAYMAPEQARGKTVDRRADIWAFGVVLHEMLTGRQAFTGEEISDVLAAVLRQDIDWTALPKDTPVRLRLLLERCLERDPRRRMRDIGEARIVLDDLMSGRSPEHTAGVPGPTPAGSSRRERVWMGVAALSLAAVLALIAWMTSRPVPAPENTLRFTIDAPPGEQFSLGPGMVTVSRDGRRVAFVTGTSPATTSLWIHSFDTLETRQVAGVTGVEWPSWSPNGRSLAFSDLRNVTGAKLRRVDVDTGNLLTLADCQPGPVAWSAQGVILFTGADKRIHQISENGGASRAVTELDTARGEMGHGSPFFLPDGRRFVFDATNQDREKGGVYLAALDSRPPVRIADAPRIANASHRVMVTSGYLLLQRDAALVAQPFDVARGVTTGEPRVVVSGSGGASWARTFSASDTGVLVLRGDALAGTVNQLTWFDRTDKPIGTVGEPARNHLPRISADGSHVVVPRVDDQAGSDLFLIDVDRDVSTRITSDGAGALPIWSPDGTHIVFMSRRSAKAIEIVERSTADGKDVVLISSPDPKTPTGISADGKYLLFNRAMGQNTQNLFALPLSGGDKTPMPIVASQGRVSGGTFSPDGHWVAYYTEDADGPQAYVVPFPPTGQRVRLSTTSGYWPQWSRDGTRIIYVTEDWHFMEVPVKVTNGTIRPGKPAELFVQRQDTPGWHSFAFDPVKERFLLAVAAHQGSTSPPLTVVLNWTAELARR